MCIRDSHRETTGNHGDGDHRETDTGADHRETAGDHGNGDHCETDTGDSGESNSDHYETEAGADQQEKHHGPRQRRPPQDGGGLRGPRAADDGGLQGGRQAGEP
eukprot:9289391-Alexandrium_andersonii.AAC.1